VPDVIAFPMHGQQKFAREGYRTRDGHLIEWLGREGNGPVAVVSRPEPMWLRPITRVPDRVAAGTEPVQSFSWRVPLPWDRRRWWSQSRGAYDGGLVATTNAPVISWNPFLGVSNVWESVSRPDRIVVVDLLDDWSSHYAFRSVAPMVEEGYRQLFARADHVTANGEGTLALAHRFGRQDAELLLNGCDPDRFSMQSTATGRTTIGYVGKIGKRVNLELVVDTAETLTECDFVFAGPILDPEYRKPLTRLPNVRLLGDVHYEKVPELLQTFDIGWVPHHVGEFEVGGDVIKTYEYRAAGLPVVTTPIADRGLNAVVVAEPVDHPSALRALIHGERVDRVAAEIPEDFTWQHKARHVASLLGIG
jgi:glycosyltransferase involved in cell wall biosynthesis